MTSTPDTIAAAIHDFEAHRDLTPALQLTIAHQRVERIRRAALEGLRLQICLLMDSITGARDPAAKAALEEQLSAAHGDVDAVRGMNAEAWRLAMVASGGRK